MAWRVELLDRRVERELAGLADDLKAKFAHIVELLEEFGPANVHEPHIKSLGRGLFEMRMSGRDGIARAAYVVARGERIVVVHVFIKKSQKTPKSALDLARQRAKEVV